MPVDFSIGDLGSLSIPGVRLPRVSARTPKTFPGSPMYTGSGGGGFSSAPTPQDDPVPPTGAPPAKNAGTPDTGLTESASTSSQAAPPNNGGLPPAPQLYQPNYDWARRASDLDRQQIETLANSPQARGGIRGKIGGVFNAIGWDFIGNPLQYPSQTDANGIRHPSMNEYEANAARAAQESEIANRAALRDQTIANEQSQRQEAQDRIRQMDLNSQRTAYDRRMDNITKAGGFEQQPIPPQYQTPQTFDASQPPSVNNLPMTAPELMIPGYTPQQLAGNLGTVEQVKDPDTGQVRSMVTPNLQTRQEMERVDAPQDILDFYNHLPAEFTKDYPVTPPQVGPDGKVAPEEMKRLEQKYQRDSAALQSWISKRAAPDNQVALAIRAAKGDKTAQKALSLMKQQSPGAGLTPEALDYWARYTATTGQTPSLGMGNAGMPTRIQILNRAPEVSGGNDAATNRATYRANTNSLSNIQKMGDAVVSFENTANKNLDLFTNSAKKIIDSGSPWINQPLRTINRNALGNADQAAFDAARQVALTEIAKVVNNPTLSSVLSDNARREVLTLNPENASLTQIYAVAQILKADMANRRTSVDQQVQEIQGRLKGAGGGQPGAMVNMRAPNGQVQPVPADQVEHYKQRGAVVVQ